MSSELTRYTLGLDAPLTPKDYDLQPSPLTLGEKYKIYPTPKVYHFYSQTISLERKWQLDLSEGIDQATEQLAYTLLEKYSKSSEEKISFQLKISPHFSHPEAYQMKITEEGIFISGKDSDGIFYGLVTLKHLLNQAILASVNQLEIEDYPDLSNRGFIEGYYGQPWSFDDRESLMRFGGELKLNGYYFAPKNDPYHNQKWRLLYPDDELKKVQHLAKVGNETKTRLIWTIHPFQSDPLQFTSPQYEKDLKAIENKFEQLMQVGVRQFGVLADDAEVTGEAKDYAKLMKDLHQFLEKKKGEYEGLRQDMILVAPGWSYSAKDGTDPMLRELNKTLDDQTLLTITGGEVFGEVSTTVLERFTDEEGKRFKALNLWVNYPVNDTTRSSLILKGASRFFKEVRPELLKGIMINPLREAEPSKLSLFEVSEYSWRLFEGKEKLEEIEKAKTAFVDHLNFKETPASEALREIIQHLATNANGEEPQGVESLKLKGKVDKLLNGQVLSNQEEEQLIEELKSLRSSLSLYLSEGRSRLLEGLRPFLIVGKLEVEAILAYLEYQKNPKSLLLKQAKAKEDEMKKHEILYNQGRYTENGQDEWYQAEFGISVLKPLLEWSSKSLS